MWTLQAYPCLGSVVRDKACAPHSAGITRVYGLHKIQAGNMLEFSMQQGIWQHDPLLSIESGSKLL